MAEFSITVGIQNVPGAAQFIQGAIFPRVSTAVRLVAQQAQADWMEAIDNAKLWAGEKRPYMASVQWEMTGPMGALVWSDYKYAAEIETGRPAKDLKRMLDTSLKVRRTKEGKRYLIIPFRHSVPGSEAIGSSMPQHVYNEARKLAPSKVTWSGTMRRSGEITEAVIGGGTMAMGDHMQNANPFASDISTRGPLMVQQASYKWGGRLGAGSMGPNPRGKVDRFAGMVRFDTSSGKQKSSTYLTFRRMVEGSPGWVVPPKAGLYLARGVSQRLLPKAEQVFAEAVKRDLSD